MTDTVHSQERQRIKLITAQQTLEGAGFPVRRPFPTRQLNDVDPFLLLDHLGPVQWGPGEAVGAPDHPHRGFETVTYLLAGSMQHKDSQGHLGNLSAGDVQWMTAGAGIVHSELPSTTLLQQGGVLHGVQIWVNLPARDKMIRPRYQDIPASAIPEVTDASGKVKVRIIAGSAMGQHAVIDTHTPIVYLHYMLQAGAAVMQSLPPQHNALVYVLSGSVNLGQEKILAQEGQLALLGITPEIHLSHPNNTEQTASLLVLAGVPLNEPVVRYGPFVMNSEAEIQQAIADYRSGRMGDIAF